MNARRLYVIRDDKHVAYDPCRVAVSRAMGRMLARGVIASTDDAAQLAQLVTADPDPLALRAAYACASCGHLTCSCDPRHGVTTAAWRASWRAYLSTVSGAPS